ncbi:MAG: hypothetical protein IJL78_00705 [Lachnospiraceae bacterium]|nr:hypothetical protein [Lachnospiraceae bacterium]
MKIDDKIIKESLAADGKLPEEMALFVSEQLGQDHEESKVRRMEASGKRKASEGRRRGLVTGLVAIAAMALLVFVAIKLIPTFRPSGEGTSTAEHGAENAQEPEAESAAESAEEDTEKNTEESLEVGDGPVDPAGTYKKIPIGGGALSWGMSESEVIGVLGEPDERTEQNAAVTLMYKKPLETDLGFTSDYAKFVIGEKQALSYNEAIVMGLNHVAFESYETVTTAADKELIRFYGLYDDYEEHVNPLTQLGEPGGDKISDRVYHWKAWELQNEPELRNTMRARLMQYNNYRGETEGRSQSADEIEAQCSPEYMPVVVSMTHPKDEAEKGVGITLDAARLMIATAPVERTVDPSHSSVYLASLTGLLETQGILGELSEAAQGKQFEIVSAPYVFEYAVLAHFRSVDEPVTYCTAYIKYKDGADPESVVLSENDDVLELSEYYIYDDLRSGEAENAADLMGRVYRDVYQMPDQETLRKGAEAAIDAFFNDRAVFGTREDEEDAGADTDTSDEDALWTEAEMEELREHLTTVSICDPNTEFADPASWADQKGLSFKDTRFKIGITADKEALSDGVREKWKSIRGDLEYFYMNVVVVNYEFRVTVYPTETDLISGTPAVEEP